MTNPVYDQDRFARVFDDGDLTGSTLGTVNADWSQDVDTIFRIRFLVQESNNKATNNADFRLRFNHGGAGYIEVGSATAVQYASSAETSWTLTDGDAISTARLGGGSISGGEYDEDNSFTNLDFGGNDQVEIEFCLTIDSASVSNNDTILFQVYEDATNPLDTYTNTPTVTVVVAAPDALTASEITLGTPNFETPTLTHIHDLTAVELTSGAPEFETPTIGQKHALTATEITLGAPEFAIPTVAEATPGDVKVRVVQAAANTGGGDQSFTDSGFGTPKAALLFVSKGTTNGTAADHAILSVGATDGTNQIVVGARSAHGVSTSDADRRGATDEVIMMLDNTATTVECEANFKQWVTDGIQITWGSNPDSAYLVTVVLIGGSDVTAKVGTLTASGDGVGNDINISDTPNVLFYLGNGTALNDTTGTSAPFNYGFASDVIANRAASMVTSNGETGTTQTEAIMYDTRSSLNQTSSNGALNRGFETTNFYTNPPDSIDGIEVTLRAGAGSADLISGYLSLSFNGNANYAIGTYQTPSSTGSDSYNGLSFTPQFVMFIANPITTASVNSNDSNQPGAIGFVFVDADDNVFSVGVADEDGVSLGTTNTQSRTDNAISFAEDDGTISHDATLTSLDNDGWTFSYSTASTVFNWPFLAIESVAGGGTDALTSVELTSGAPEFENPTLTHIHNLTAVELTSGAPEFETPTIGQEHALTAVELTSGAPEFETPTLGQTHPLVSVELTSGAPEFETPAIGQEHALAAVELTSGAPEFETPAIGQEHALAAVELTSGAPEFGIPTLTEGADNLTAAEITLGTPEFETPTLGQVHALVATEISSGAPEFALPSVSNVIDLVANELTMGAPILGSPTISLVIIVTAVSRIYRINPEDRVYEIKAEDRSFNINPEDRTFDIPTER